MTSRRTIPALGAFFVAVAIAIAGCGGSIPGDSVAVVAGNPITTRAFNHWMFVAAKEQAASAPGEPVIVPNDPPNFTKCVAQVKAEIPSLAKTAAKQLRADCKQLFTSLSSQVMDFLVKSYWYQADAHKAGLKVTNAQIQTALAAAKKSQFSTAAQFNAYLSSTGQTLDDVTFRLRIQQVYTKLLAKYPTTVTPAAISAYYNSHLSQFSTPELRNLKIVLAKSPAVATTALTALKHGQSWAVVAKRYSIDPTTKNKGGVLTNVSKSGQDAALSTAAFGAPLNKLEGPVKGQFGYYVLEVTKITPAVTRTLAQSTTLIRQTLTSQLQTSAENKVNAHAKKNWYAKTQCRGTYAMADCTGFKASSSSSSSASASAPATSG